MESNHSLPDVNRTLYQLTNLPFVAYQDFNLAKVRLHLFNERYLSINGVFAMLCKQLKMAASEGFEPPVDLRPLSISSRMH